MQELSTRLFVFASLSQLVNGMGFYIKYLYNIYEHTYNPKEYLAILKCAMSNVSIRMYGNPELHSIFPSLYSTSLSYPCTASVSGQYHQILSINTP